MPLIVFAMANSNLELSELARQDRDITVLFHQGIGFALFIHVFNLVCNGTVKLQRLIFCMQGTQAIIFWN